MADAGSLKLLFDKFLDESKKCIEVKDVRPIIEIWEKELIDILSEFLKKKLWSSEEFLFLNIALLFKSKFLELRKKSIGELKSSSYYVSKVGLELVKFYSKTLKLIKSGVDKPEILKPLNPLRWLELGPKYKLILDEKIISKIKLAHFNLDIDLAENGKPPGKTFEIDQAAEFLSEKLNEKVTPQNVLEYCISTDDFAAYLLREKYSSDPQSNGISPMILYVEEELAQNRLTYDFKYEYKGLIRLIKKYQDHDDFRKPYTVQYLCEGGSIVIKSYRLLILQLSLSEYILGKHAGVEINYETIIRLQDLRFVKEELEIFVKNKYKKNRSKPSRGLSGESDVLDPVSMGALGGNKKREKHDHIIEAARTKTTQLMSQNPNLMQPDIILYVEKFLTNQNHVNSKGLPFASTTIKKWVKDLIPPEKCKTGRPAQS